MQRWTGESSAQKSVTPGSAFFRAVSTTRSISSDTPSPFTALMGTTGTPMRRLSC